MEGSLKVTFERSFAASSSRRFLDAASSWSSNDKVFRCLKLVDNVWSSLSALLKREAAADESSFDEEDCDGLFVDIGVGTTVLEEELDNRLSDDVSGKIEL